MRLSWLDRWIRIIRDEPRKAPKNCPHCGRRMVTRTIYYECQGCGHTENLPHTRPNRDSQPVDRLHADIKTSKVQDRLRDGAFAIVVVPVEMASEYCWLYRAGWILVMFVLGFWGISIWMGIIANLDELFVTCWRVIALGAALIALALFHSSRFLKQLGIVVALILIPILIYTHQLALGMWIAGNQGSPIQFVDWLGRAFAVHVFIAAAVYCAWLAWFLIRERRLQGR